LKGSEIIWKAMLVLLIGAMLMVSPGIIGGKATAKPQDEVVTMVNR
jgi:hypothetical protein